MKPSSITLILLLVLLAPCPGAALTDIGSVALQTLTRSSSAIAVASVDQVLSVGGVKVAVATTLQPLKGLAANQRFAFIAQSTSTGDTSTAQPGEKALLFLRRFSPENVRMDPRESWAEFEAARAAQLGDLLVYQIAHAGHGRIPVLKSNGEETLYATPNYPPSEPRIIRIGMVSLPSGVPYYPHPERPNVMPSGKVLLADVAEQVRRLAKPQALGGEAASKP